MQQFSSIKNNGLWQRVVCLAAVLFIFPLNCLLQHVLFQRRASKVHIRSAPGLKNIRGHVVQIGSYALSRPCLSVLICMITLHFTLSCLLVLPTTDKLTDC